MTDEIPFTEEAERQVLAAMLMSAEHAGRAKRLLGAGDFHRPNHARIFAAVASLHASGRSAYGGATTAVADHLRKDGQGDPIPTADLLLLADAWLGGPPDAAAAIVLRDATARRVIDVAADLRAEAYRNTLAPADLLDACTVAISRIEVPAEDEARLDNVQTFPAAIRSADETPEPWVIPGLLRRGWRAVIVAGEGAGKSWIMRQLAGAAAAGVHPFALSKMDPIVALVIDLENPRDAIAESLSAVDRIASRAPGYTDGVAYIDARPGGMDLRSRTGRLDLEALVSKLHPNLVCLGPVYKMYRAGRGETDEMAAGEAMDVLDDLRTRYGFALVLEHHAPKGTGGAREIIPHGTALWLRWPELGIRLTRCEKGAPGSLDVSRWRPDRVTCTWPVRLDRGGPGAWPWTGSYSAAMTYGNTP